MGTKHGQGKKVVCVECGGQFTAQGKKTTCSTSCRDSSKKKRFPGVESHLCGYALCENVIPGGPVRLDRQYCSIECSKLSRKMRTSNVLNVNDNYVRIAGPMVDSHPIFSANGRWARLHVIVAYDKYGPGPHSCYWCGQKIDWYFGSVHASATTGEYKIVVDHVNSVRIDNRSENLVLSCNSCNLRRSRDHKPV